MTLTNAEQIKKYQDLIIKIQAEERELTEKQQKIANLKFKEVRNNPDNWEWRVIPTTESSFMNDTKYNGIRVEKRIKQQILKDNLEEFRCVGSDFTQLDRWFGMFYYRTEENILHSTGGGYYTLNSPMLCNDQEWQDILMLKIANKYIYNNKF